VISDKSGRETVETPIWTPC